MNNQQQDSFCISGLGGFRFVVSLAGIDYPLIFVAQQTSRNKGTFLFYQIESDENSVTWAAVQITFAEFDDLNRGRKTVQDCFVGPRRSLREGYIVKSEAGKEVASCEKERNIFWRIDHEPFYPDEFVPEQHGSGPLSLLLGHPVFSVVLDDDPYCLPEMTSTRMNESSKTITRLFNTLPFRIHNKPNYYFVSDHSFVINFEILDAYPEDENPNQTKLDIDIEEESESEAAIKAVKSVIAGDTSEKELVENFKGDTDALDKCVAFVNSLKKFNPKGSIQVAVCSPDESMEHYEIGEKTMKIIAETAKKAKDVIRNEDAISSTMFRRSGQFKMIDHTGKTGFKFKCNGEDKLIRGYFDNPDEIRETQLATNKEYLAIFRQIVYKGDFGETKPIIRLISAEETKPPIQTSIFDEQNS